MNNFRADSDALAIYPLIKIGKAIPLIRGNVP